MFRKYIGIGSIILLLLVFCCFFKVNEVNAVQYPEINDPNKILMQAYYWEMNKGEYAKKYPQEANLWQLLTERADELAELGITGLWLPPANKAYGGKNDEGYAAYDLWDLGEFRQKGSTRTKYGTKKELLQAINTLHHKGIKVYYDAVLNHRMGGDRKEQVPLASGEKTNIWTDFNLAGRKKYYNRAKKWGWNWKAFDASGNHLFKNKTWDNTVDKDYLMGNDVDYQNLEVKRELIEWGKWIINDIGFDGFRLDAVKHIDTAFVKDWIKTVQSETDKDVLFIGEAWYESKMGLYFYLISMKNKDLSVFDFPLRNKFSMVRDGNLNMSALNNVGLVNKKGMANRVVTFVDNHDTGRDIVEYCSPIFNRKCQVYTYILTRARGLPMVFWKDYFNSEIKKELQKIIQARKYFAYGPGHEVDNNDKDVYSYVREGLENMAGTGLVMMITGGNSGEIITKKINSHQPQQTYYDLTGNIADLVVTDNKGYGMFKVKNEADTGWSIWVPMI